MNSIKEVLTMKNMMAFPMLSIQLIMLTYFFIVLLIYIPYLKEYYFIHLPIITSLLTLAATSLI